MSTILDLNLEPIVSNKLCRNCFKYDDLNINVGHLNCRSISRSSRCTKLDTLSNLFEGNIFDIFAAGKNWLNNYFSDAIVDLPGYNVAKNDRPVSRGERVALYTSSKLHFT